MSALDPATTYWLGVATPFLAAVIVLLLILLTRAGIWLYRRFVRPLLEALRLLLPTSQRHAVELFERDLRQSFIALQRADLAHALEAAVTSKARLPAAHRWSLRFARWGLLPILAEATPRLADAYREAKVAWEAKWQAETAARDVERAERAKRDAAANARITELVGDPNTDAARVHYGGKHPFRAGLDEVVYLPAASDFEPDPDRPNIMVKSPALAVRVQTRSWPTLTARMAGDAHARYAGIAVMRRLRAEHPHLFRESLEGKP